MLYQKEHAVVSKLSREIIALVDRAFGKKRSIKSKSAQGDLVTDIDLAVDRLVRKRLTDAFGDTVITEETPGTQQMTKGRVWVVDPICGTSNLAHGVRFFCTNIALLEKGKVAGAWVIDHHLQRVISSAGARSVSIGRKRIPRIGKRASHNRICVNWGYWHHVPLAVRRRYSAFTVDLLFTRDVWVLDYNTSLEFAYIATGQMDAAVVINVYPWDLLASSFLVQQNGGYATNFDGTPVTTHTKSAVFAANASFHRRLLKLLKKHSLSTVQ
jgi:myo-inositol-1(or 4)-monophosphatase